MKEELEYFRTSETGREMGTDLTGFDENKSTDDLLHTE